MKNSICVTPYNIRQWETTIEVAKGVYITASDAFNAELKAAREEVEQWRDWYYSLKRQVDATKAEVTNKEE